MVLITTIGLVIALSALLQILVKQGSPVDNQQTIGIVLRSGHSFQLTCRHKLPPEDGGTALDTLAAIVGDMNYELRNI